MINVPQKWKPENECGRNNAKDKCEANKTDDDQSAGEPVLSDTLPAHAKPQESAEDEEIGRRIKVQFMSIELSVKDIVEKSDKKAGWKLEYLARIIDRPGASERVKKGQPDRGCDENEERLGQKRLTQFKSSPDRGGAQ